MRFVAYKNNVEVDNWLVFSVGGGSLKELNEERDTFKQMVYPHSRMNEILEYISKTNMSLVDYVLKYETQSIKEYLSDVLVQMRETLNNGLYTDGILPGGLKVNRKASSFYQKYLLNPSLEALTYSYALAISEENASGGKMVTAPTCGSCGVVPATLLSYQLLNNISDEKIIESLMVAGLVGNIVKTNASISGAEVGCQGEIGVACAMASAAMAYLTGKNSNEIEYAAEIALEHHLGMTCDPVDGLVQIPCIERNAVAAMQAHNVSKYVELAGSEHHITLDSVIEVMEETGKDLHAKYRETSKGGLALHRKY
jgi:L-serine dehydratase